VNTSKESGPFQLVAKGTAGNKRYDSIRQDISSQNPAGIVIWIENHFVHCRGEYFLKIYDLESIGVHCSGVSGMVWYDRGAVGLCSYGRLRLG